MEPMEVDDSGNKENSSLAQSANLDRSDIEKIKLEINCLGAENARLRSINLEWPNKLQEIQYTQVIAKDECNEPKLKLLQKERLNCLWQQKNRKMKRKGKTMRVKLENAKKAESATSTENLCHFEGCKRSIQGLGFVNRHLLRQHVRVVHGSKWICCYCKGYYATKVTRDKHISTIHA